MQLKPLWRAVPRSTERCWCDAHNRNARVDVYRTVLVARSSRARAYTVRARKSSRQCVARGCNASLGRGMAEGVRAAKNGFQTGRRGARGHDPVATHKRGA